MGGQQGDFSTTRRPKTCHAMNVRLEQTTLRDEIHVGMAPWHGTLCKLLKAQHLRHTTFAF
jgi:hypothetical protein